MNFYEILTYIFELTRRLSLFVHSPNYIDIFADLDLVESFSNLAVFTDLLLFDTFSALASLDADLATFAIGSFRVFAFGILPVLPKNVAAVVVTLIL